MAKFGDSFGLDDDAIERIDWDLALSRVLQDLKSDFIYAPHLSFIFARAGSELIASLKKQLRAGTFLPALPITVEVPKSSRMKILGSRRAGPLFTRPGSILFPRDRLLFQALADQAAATLDEQEDKKRSFSHRLADVDSAHMFLPTRVCWNGLQKTLLKHSRDKRFKFVVKLDIADFFGSINQHTLINTLGDIGYSKALAERLEVMLTGYTGSRSSRGILQGLAPSDLFGNHYLDPIDRFLEEYGVASARYVDDIYVFVTSVAEADKLMRALTVEFRTYDLVVNEAKSRIIPKASLLTEEPDLEALFEDAIEEVSAQIDEDDFDAEYGFQSEWEDDELDDEDDDQDEDEENDELELRATKLLFDAIGGYAGQEEAIERFCLPLFAASQSDYAVAHVLEAFKRRPSMSQIYTSYLQNFLADDAVYTRLEQLLADEALLDWQAMWILAALLRVKPPSGEPIKVAWAIFKDANRHDALRSIAAIFVGRYGDLARRKALSAAYPSASAFVQTAIYYSSRGWPLAERRTAKAMWGNQGDLNSLLTIAMK